MNQLKTKEKSSYEFPTVEVTDVELEGLIAVSQILVEPDKDNFNRYQWDSQTETESQDIEFLL